MPGEFTQTDKNSHRIFGIPVTVVHGKNANGINARQGRLSCFVVILSNSYKCMSDRNDCIEGRARRRGEKDWPLGVRSLIFYNIRRNSGVLPLRPDTPFFSVAWHPNFGRNGRETHTAFMGLSQRTKNRLGFFCHYMQ